MALGNDGKLPLDEYFNLPAGLWPLSSIQLLDPCRAYTKNPLFSSDQACNSSFPLLVPTDEIVCPVLSPRDPRMESVDEAGGKDPALDQILMLLLISGERVQVEQFLRGQIWNLERSLFPGVVLHDSAFPLLRGGQVHLHSVKSSPCKRRSGFPR